MHNPNGDSPVDTRADQVYEDIMESLYAEAYKAVGENAKGMYDELNDVCGSKIFDIVCKHCK